jgi:hypothetical protein
MVKVGIEVAEKSNELVAILKLLDLLATEGDRGSIGCQRDRRLHNARRLPPRKRRRNLIPRPPSGVAVFCVVV